MKWCCPVCLQLILGDAPGWEGCTNLRRKYLWTEALFLCPSSRASGNVVFACRKRQPAGDSQTRWLPRAQHTVLGCFVHCCFCSGDITCSGMLWGYSAAYSPCRRSYKASVYSDLTGRKIAMVFVKMAESKVWVFCKESKDSQMAKEPVTEGADRIVQTHFGEQAALGAKHQHLNLSRQQNQYLLPPAVSTGLQGYCLTLKITRMGFLF